MGSSTWLVLVRGCLRERSVLGLALCLVDAALQLTNPEKALFLFQQQVDRALQQWPADWMETI